eukprot:TRINITY_DN508_c0_g1_i2.p1 TRINITY_DN508_c0_g1~~TRINITY_DN508_c0_g1_i2.p1  ORF type:complete len:525 (+),score=159.44 TRINITY_DN508_c0_g1_i2:77-1576(+)
MHPAQTPECDQLREVYPQFTNVRAAMLLQEYGSLEGALRAIDRAGSAEAVIAASEPSDVRALQSAFPQVSVRDARVLIGRHGSVESACESLLSTGSVDGYEEAEADFAERDGISLLCPKCFGDDVVAEREDRALCQNPRCLHVFHKQDAKGGWARPPKQRRRKKKTQSADEAAPAAAPRAAAPAAARAAPSPETTDESPTAAPSGPMHRLEAARARISSQGPRVRLCVRRADGRVLDRKGDCRVLVVPRAPDVRAVCKVARQKFKGTRKAFSSVTLADGTRLANTLDVADGTEVFVCAREADSGIGAGYSSSSPSTPNTPAADISGPQPELPPPLPAGAMGACLDEGRRVMFDESACRSAPMPVARQDSLRHSSAAECTSGEEGERRRRRIADGPCGPQLCAFMDKHRLDASAQRALVSLSPPQTEQLLSGLRGRRPGTNLSAVVTKRIRHMHKSRRESHHCDPSFPPSPRELKEADSWSDSDSAAPAASACRHRQRHK